MRFFLIICTLFTCTVGHSLAAVGSLIKTFDYEVFKFAQDPVRARIYATTTNNSVIVIDTDTVSVIQEIFIGSQPRGLDVNADASRLFVACSGSSTAGIGVIDLTTLTKLPSLPTPFKPSHVVAGLANRLYVTFAQDESIKQLSSLDGTVQNSTSYPLAYYPDGVLAITPDRKTLIYGDVGLSPSTLLKFDVSDGALTLSQQSTFGTVGENGERLIMSRGGTSFCYATGAGQGGYGIALIPVNDLNGTIGTFHTDAYPANGAFGPDDAIFYSAPASQNVVRIFSTATFSQIGSFPITTDDDPGDIICDLKGRRLYVASLSYFDEPTKVRVYSLTAGNLAITSADSATAHEGESFAFTLTSNDPTATFSATGLPAGLKVDAASGLISGTPIQAGIFKAFVSVTSSDFDQSTAELNIDVQTPFTVTINGHGTVAPGGAGVTWQTIGATVALSAEPDSGFGFVGWTGAIVSTNQYVVVTVQKGSAVQATFSQLIPFTVTANGPGQVSAQYAGTTNQPLGATLTILAIPNEGAHFTGWTGAVTSLQNPLQVSVQANATLIANFDTQPLVPLTVFTSGPGQVSPDLLGTTLHAVGSNVVIEATPTPGARFVGWTGAVTSTANPLVLEFAGAATIVANFESFTIYGGHYVAVAPPDASGVHLIALRVSLDSRGAFTGRLDYGGIHFPFVGAISDLYGAYGTLESGSMSVRLFLNVSLVNGVPALMATVEDGSTTYGLQGFRTAAFGGRIPAPMAGRYTFLIPPPPPGPNALSLGVGNGIAKITRTGAVIMSGTLGDGSAFTAGGGVSEDNHMMLTVLLYQGGGYLSGKLDFRDLPGLSDFDGVLNWSRPAQRKGRYREGFSIAATFLGGRYLAPEAGTNLFDAFTGNVTISGGDLPSALTAPITFGPRNKVIPGHPAYGLQCTLQSGTGLWSGSFLPARNSVPRTFSGVIYQKMPEAVALHRGPISAGSVVLVPTP